MSYERDGRTRKTRGATAISASTFAIFLRIQSIKLALSDGTELRAQDVFARVSEAVFIVEAQPSQGRNSRRARSISHPWDAYTVRLPCSGTSRSLRSAKHFSGLLSPNPRLTRIKAHPGGDQYTPIYWRRLHALGTMRTETKQRWTPAHHSGSSLIGPSGTLKETRR